MKPRSALGIAIVAIFTGVTAYTIMHSSKHAETNAGTQVAAVSSDKSQEQHGSGTYDEYSYYRMSMTKGQILLYFHDDTREQCRSLEKQMSETGIPDGVAILKVDYTQYPEMRQKYGVAFPATYVKVDRKGNLIQMYSAYSDPNFATVKSSLLGA